MFSLIAVLSASDKEAVEKGSIESLWYLERSIGKESAIPTRLSLWLHEFLFSIKPEAG